MNDKRSESTRPSARPPLPSIAPPTEDIDSEWGADEIPAPAKVPQVAAAAPAPSAPPAAAPSAPPTAAPSYPPAPEPPVVRPSAPAAAQAPAAAASNPLRKQTLLGMAPVIPAQRSEPPAVAKPASEPPRPSVTSSPPRASQPAAAPAPVAENPLRKQTLLGIMAPVIPPRSEPPVAEAKPSSPPVEPASTTAPSSPPEAVNQAESSIAAIEAAQAATADAVSSDAPITRDVKSSRPPAARSAVAAARAEQAPISTGDHDLPELRPRRSRWVYLLAAAAVLGGGVFMLRKMDRAPQQLDESLARPLRPADDKPAAAAIPKSDEGDDTDSEPNPAEPTEPEPLKAPPPSDVAASAAPLQSAAPTPSATATAATAEAPSSGELTRVNIESDPPGARMFRRGKEVGTTPFTLEVPAGERRSYELGKPGFVTRKVVIDGTKTGITIGLKPEE